MRLSLVAPLASQEDEAAVRFKLSSSIVCSERNQISNQTELRGDWTFRCEAFERTPSFPANISRLSCKSVICAGAGITLRAHSDPSPAFRFRGFSSVKDLGKDPR